MHHGSSYFWSCKVGSDKLSYYYLYAVSYPFNLRRPYSLVIDSVFWYDHLRHIHIHLRFLLIDFVSVNKHRVVFMRLDTLIESIFIETKLINKTMY